MRPPLFRLMREISLLCRSVRGVRLGSTTREMSGNPGNSKIVEEVHSSVSCHNIFSCLITLQVNDIIVLVDSTLAEKKLNDNNRIIPIGNSRICEFYSLVGFQLSR